MSRMLTLKLIKLSKEKKKKPKTPRKREKMSRLLFDHDPTCIETNAK